MWDRVAPPCANAPHTHDRRPYFLAAAPFSSSLMPPPPSLRRKSFPLWGPPLFHLLRLLIDSTSHHLRPLPPPHLLKDLLRPSSSSYIVFFLFHPVFYCGRSRRRAVGRRGAIFGRALYSPFLRNGRRKWINGSGVIYQRLLCGYLFGMEKGLCWCSHCYDVDGGVVNSLCKYHLSSAGYLPNVPWPGRGRLSSGERLRESPSVFASPPWRGDGVHHIHVTISRCDDHYDGEGSGGRKMLERERESGRHRQSEK